MEVVPDHGKGVELTNQKLVPSNQTIVWLWASKEWRCSETLTMPKEGQIFHTTSTWFLPLGVNSSLKQAQK